MKNLNLNSLRMFAVAARHGSFLNAAAELNLSQGAVSQRIKQLELALGVRLFEREPRGVSLTKAGEELVQTVETSLRMIEKAAHHILRFENEITLQVSPSIARKWLTPRLPEFFKLNPKVQLNIEARAEVLRRPLHHNEIAMRHGKSFASVKGQQMRRLVEIDLVAVCSPSLADVGTRPDLRHILSLPLIQDTHCRWDRLIALEPSTTTSKPLNFNSASLAIDAATNKQGVAIVPSIFVQSDIDEGHLREIWRDVTPSGEYLFLLWPKSQPVSEPMNRLVNWIQHKFGHDATG